MISHLGPQLGVADGIALHNLLDNNKKLLLYLQVKVARAREIFTKH